MTPADDLLEKFYDRLSNKQNELSKMLEDHSIDIEGKNRRIDGFTKVTFSTFSRNTTDELLHYRNGYKLLEICKRELWQNKPLARDIGPALQQINCSSPQDHADLAALLDKVKDQVSEVISDEEETPFLKRRLAEADQKLGEFEKR